MQLRAGYIIDGSQNTNIFFICKNHVVLFSLRNFIDQLVSLHERYYIPT